MDKICDFGIIKYEYVNEATQYISDFVDYDHHFYGIYFKRDLEYYIISYNFFDNNIAYFTDKIFKLEVLIKLVSKIYFYPQTNPNFLLISDIIVKKTLNICKDNFGDYNLGKYIINKILNKVKKCKIETNTHVNDCFKFLFKIPNLIDKSYFSSPTLEKKITLKPQESIIDSLKYITIEEDVVIPFDHSKMKMELFSKVNNLYWINKDKYTKLMENYIEKSNNKLNSLNLRLNINQTENSIKKINDAIQIGFVESKDIQELILNINKILDYIGEKKLKINESNLYAYEKKFKLKDLEYKDYNMTIIDPSYVIDAQETNLDFVPTNKISDKRFYTKNLNENKNISYLRDLLKYINSIYKSYPFDKQLIGIQNEIIKKIIEIEKKGDYVN